MNGEAMRKIVFQVSFLLLMTNLYAQIKSPEEFLGFEVGADRKLADWEQIVDYFQTLNRASQRVLVQDLGQTTLGKPFLLAIISSPETLSDLVSYQNIQKTLADPRKTEKFPEELLERGKTVILITCGIHSTEVASSQMSMEFVYELATAEDRETREILENVIFLFVPSLNPDGVDIVTHWYRKTVGTVAEGTSPPELYHAYTGHDNNRDWFMFTQKETRLAIEKIHNVWHPQIVFDVHQMGSNGARMFVPPFIDPIEPNVDPILQAGVIELGATLFAALTQKGKSGVVINAIYDAYTPARAYQHYHGGVRILSESASARLATPVKLSVDQLVSGRNYNVHLPSWNFPVPWKGGEWRVRDIVDYQKIALRAALLHAARYRKNWLRNFFNVGVNAIQRRNPFAFVFPGGQRDPQGLFDLLGILQFGLVEIHRAQASFTVSESQLVSAPLGEQSRREFPAGSHIILAQQPYSSFAKTLLEIQHYPELRQYPNGPLRRPYDVTAHTLGIQLGVETYQISEQLEIPLERVENIQIPNSDVKGKGRYWLFSHTNNAFARLSNRLLRAGHSVRWAPNGFRSGGRGFPVGSLLADIDDDTDISSLLAELPVTIYRVSRRPDVAWQSIHLPRVGLYKNFDPSIDEGWTRWILEQYEFSYRSLFHHDIRQGHLSELDVIVIPHQDADRIKNGLREPYPLEYQGGLGEEGLAKLREFTEKGGTLVLLGDSTRLVLDEWDLGVVEVTRKLSPEEFYIPGSLLRVEVNNSHPLGYGLLAQSAVMFRNNPVFQLSGGQRIVAYATKDLLLSGWADGEEHIRGETGLAMVEIGRGRVILIGFLTQFRAQMRATYKFLFNSLYYATIQ